MFGALKKLFGKEEEAPQQPPPAKPASPPSQQGRSPAPTPAPAAPPAKPAADYTAPADGQAVQIPLKSIAESFPPQLASFAPSAPKGNFALPLNQALGGLARGLVTVPFGHLRQAAPSAFGQDPVHDATEVTIPIQEIVTRLPKGALKKNPAQKPFQIPKIGDLFGSRGEALKPVDLESTAGAPPVNRVAPAPPAVAPTIPKAPVAPVITQPAMPEHKPVEDAPVFEAPKLAPQEKIPIALPTLEAQKPIAPANLPQPPSPKAAPMSASFASATPSGAATPKVSTAGQTLSVALDSISTAWPPGIRQEIAAAQAQTIHIPLDKIESALKRGKVVFRYAEIRSWAVPAVSTPSQMDEVELDLPLNVVAPLFMAKARPAPPRSTVSLENIPDVFAGTKTAVAATPAAEPAPVKMAAPSPAPVAAPTPIPAPPAPRPPAATMPTTPIAPTPPAGPRPAPNVLGTIFGEPGRSDWPPAEIVKKTAAFRGVSGAVIGSHDGLLIAAQVAEGLSGDAIAGLLAQVCQKLNQQATELNLNPVTELNVVFGDSTWRIFRLKENYFIVIGKPKEELPAAQLRMIANELGKR